MPKGKALIFTDEQKAFMAQHRVLTTPALSALFADKFGVTIIPASLRHYRLRHGLQSSSNGRFKKGHVPYTKGKKWDEFMSREGQAQSRATQFKKGHVANIGRRYNGAPIYAVGTERARADFTFVKVAEPNVWREKRRVVWEAARGPVPVGRVIISLDGNVHNCDLSNLMLATKAQNIIINHRIGRGTNPEATIASVHLAGLLAGISKAEKAKRRE
ncbi:MAG: HNH endonuclease [Dehalococcoidia bacterium]|nr:HNH endonuclease [Dehalococcoidia bacterium]